MGEHKKAKLFSHGGSQAVRLPKEFRFEGVEVRIRKDGDKVILEPVMRDLAAIWAELDRLAEEAGDEFPNRPPQPPADAPVSFDD